MDIRIGKTYDFIPEWEGNKEEAQPVVFHMRYLTTGERETLIRYEFGEDGKVKIVPDRKGLLQAAVLSIEGLKVNGEPCASIRSLLSYPGFDFLVIEAVADVMAQNARQDPKNS